jgi:hypothetical protein
MYILTTILLTIAVLVILALVIALFTKKSYVIRREININKPKSEVFNYIRLIKNQYEFNHWMMQDPHAATSSAGIDGTIGYVEAWDSKNKQVGAGEQEIKNISEGDAMEIEVRFIRPFKGIARNKTVTTSVSDSQTLVKAEFSSSMNYPLNLMLLFINMENMLGKDMETTLNNLKKQLEK